MNSIIGFLLAGLVFGLLTLVLFWWGGSGAPAALKRWLAGDERSAAQAEWPMIFGGVLDRVFGTDAFSLRFIAAALVTSVLAFLLFFATYLLKLPTFAASLFEDIFQRQAVMKQLLTMFVPMNFFITYLSLAYCRDVVMRMERAGAAARLPVLLLKDVAMKVGIVLMAMGLVYLLLTPGGSFRSPQDALLAVPGVFWGALHFQNLNCVYIYSALVSSVWLWAWLLSGLFSRGGTIRLLGLIAAAISAVFYWLAVLLT